MKETFAGALYAPDDESGDCRLFAQNMAAWLKEQGVGKGDCVAIYMPMLLELPIAMLACARIGAIHSVVFGGFSAEALSGALWCWLVGWLKALGVEV